MSWSRRRTGGMWTRSWTRWSPAASRPAFSPGRTAMTRRPAPLLLLDRNDQHAVDSAAIHLDNLEAPVPGGDPIGDDRHPVEASHQIAAQGVKIRPLAGQARHPEHLL